MKLVSMAVIVVVLCATVMFDAGAWASDCRVVVLKDGDDGLALEIVTLVEGETTLFGSGKVITVIVPFGIGMSGDLLKAEDVRREMGVHCEGGEIRITSYRPDGTDRALPVVPVADLDAYDIRVNVTTGDGRKRAFKVRAYRQIETDDGPVIDMFGGAIPMVSGDYSVTTEVSEAEARNGVYGHAALRYVDGLLFTEGRTTDGTTGTFIVDFGAGGTVVAREFLPDDAEIEELLAIEHSGEGSRVLPGTMSGAGGEVAGFLGRAELAGFSIGSITFGDTRVSVIDEMPDFGDAPIAGILGLDVLARAAVVSFGYDDEARLVMKPSSSDAGTEGSIELPFRMAADHIFVEGGLGAAPVTFLFDTGARGTIVPESVAEASGLGAGEEVDREFRGLDGNPLPARVVTVEGLTLGAELFPPMQIYVADLPVLANWGLDETSGLLGNDFLENYDRVELDFEGGVLRLR
jgi:predicted aspartyl protease